MLSNFTLIYIYTRTSHTFKKWDFSSAFDRANCSISPLFFCVVGAWWRTCSFRRKIKYWNGVLGLSTEATFLVTHISWDKTIYKLPPSFTLTRHLQSITKNQYLPYLIFSSVTISQFLLLYHRKFSEVQSQTFVDLENCIFEGYLNPTLKRFL